TIIPHRFPDRLAHLAMYGIYNVGLVSFRNDDSGLSCLQRWREQCIEWCYDRVDDGRFADQRYLDDWPTQQSAIVVIEDPGSGLAPWHFAQYTIDPDVDPPTVDDRALVFYHFQGFKSVGPGLYDLGLSGYGTMPR